MKNFILGSIITFLVTLCIYLYIQNNSLSSSLNTYRNDKALLSKEFQKVKEDYYIQQQSDNTNLILVTVTILFAIFTATTFIGVKSEFDSKIKETNDKYENQKAEYENSVTHINNLKSGFSFHHANNLHKDFKDLLNNKPIDVSLLVELGIVVCEHYCYSVGYNSNSNEKFDDSVTLIISSVIDKMLINTENCNEVKLVSMDYSRFISAKKVIETVIDEENSRRFYKIISKLSFSNLH